MIGMAAILCASPELGQGRSRSDEDDDDKEMAGMSRQATGTFAVKSWDEHAYDETEGLPKLTRASVTGAFEGDVEGEGTVEYLMMYRNAGAASFVGLHRVVGRVGDREGSLVLQVSGTYEDDTATETWSVVPGSGTGDLSDLRGDGGLVAGHEMRGSFRLDYRFD
jgi:Protein of unknown function (DUF3224)